MESNIATTSHPSEDPSRTTYADLNAPPRFLNSGTSDAGYQAASTANSAHQCIQCFQCNQCHQCHQCVASNDVECPQSKRSK